MFRADTQHDLEIHPSFETVTTIQSTMIHRITLFFFFNFLALAIGGLFTTDGVKSEWYILLNKAPWTPAGWVFGSAWTVIMICFAFYMADLWSKVKPKRTVIGLYMIQWILNVSWNPVFFKYHFTITALIIISSLTILIGFMFFSYSKLLGLKTLLIAPYLLWLIIATSLNAYICLKN